MVVGEYGEMLNRDKSRWVKGMLDDLGFVGWGGWGFMGGRMGKIEGVVGNGGVGVGMEVEGGMNVGVDLGGNFGNDESLLYLNMREGF